MRVWRICRAAHAGSAFSGEGARLFAARWNPVGAPMVYTSLSLSLAAMEVFVHLDLEEQPEDLVSLAAELPVGESDAERVEMKRLPKDWRRVGHPALRLLGAEWVAAGRSLVLLVPSAVVDGEWNALVNPGHPDAKGIRMEAPRAFRFDARMFR